MRLSNVDEHHECVGEAHVVIAFDSDLLSEVFSQAVHKAFNCIVIFLLVMRVALTVQVKVACFHAFDGEEWA